MSFNCLELLSLFYCIAGVAWVTYISLDRVKTKNWHMLVAFTAFFPVALGFLAFQLTIVALYAFKRWAIKEI